jgi:hypothetical protein
MTERLKRTRHPGIFESGSSYVVRYRDQVGRQRQKTCRTLDEASAFARSESGRLQLIAPAAAAA